MCDNRDVVYVREGVRIRNLLDMIERLEKTTKCSHPAVCFSLGPRELDSYGMVVEDGAAAVVESMKLIGESKLLA